MRNLEFSRDLRKIWVRDMNFLNEEDKLEAKVVLWIECPTLNSNP